MNGITFESLLKESVRQDLYEAADKEIAKHREAFEKEMAAMEIRSGYEPKENFPQVVVSPFEDASNNKEMYFKCGTRHMKAMVLAMLQDVLDQAGGFCMIDVSEVIKAVEDI